ncbi:hypothetical protein LTR17_019860 [Elasticomyces elasticus]|nr:hypothetical protein LTR17_019860 [Elasticomyces elasticus]
MRLLKCAEDGTISLTTHFDTDRLPAYAILSHTWGADEDEASFEDVVNDEWSKRLLGAKKIQFCAEQAKSDGLEYFWVDTCCINKASSSELQEAINSMFDWYRKARVCYVYLTDVLACDKRDEEYPIARVMADFRRSRWFTRGWTLQELLAPYRVEFYSIEWTKLGTKQELRQHIVDVAALPPPVLNGLPLNQFSVRDRLVWGASRCTKRSEDAAYSMFGIFGVSMPLLYGEGKTRAFRRLFAEIKKEAQYLPSDLVPGGAWCRMKGSASPDGDKLAAVKSAAASVPVRASKSPARPNSPMTSPAHLCSPQHQCKCQLYSAWPCIC